jgi:hypothetical protein
VPCRFIWSSLSHISFIRRWFFAERWVLRPGDSGEAWTVLPWLISSLLNTNLPIFIQPSLPFEI